MPGPTVPYYDSAADETVRAIVAGQRAEIYFMEVSNPNNADLFLQLFDAESASDVVLGTTTPTLSFLIPAADSAGLRGAFDRMWNYPIQFRRGLFYAVTTTATGNTGPAVDCNLNAGFLPKSRGQ